MNSPDMEEALRFFSNLDITWLGTAFKLRRSHKVPGSFKSLLYGTNIFLQDQSWPL